MDETVSHGVECDHLDRVAGVCVSCGNGLNTPELVTETDTPEAWGKFASSLESQADEMTEAMEAFIDYPDVIGGFMATASWLRRTAKAIREIV